MLSFDFVDDNIKQSPIPTITLELLPVELVSNRIGKENSHLKDTGSQSATHSGEELFDSDPEREGLLHREVSQAPSSPPDFADNQTLPTRKKPPSLKQLNIARKRLRPQVIPTVLERLVEPRPSVSSFSSLEKSPLLKDIPSGTREVKEPIPEFPLWINRRRHSGFIPQIPFQLMPYTAQPSNPHSLDSVKLSSPDINTSLQADEPYRTPYEDNDMVADEGQDTTTSTIITTTVITTEQSPGI